VRRGGVSYKKLGGDLWGRAEEEEVNESERKFTTSQRGDIKKEKRVLKYLCGTVGRG